MSRTTRSGWGNDGRVPHEEAMRCIQLLGEEVVPAVREIGEELGIHDTL
jgi:hypothetical protein